MVVQAKVIMRHKRREKSFILGLSFVVVGHEGKNIRLRRRRRLRLRLRLRQRLRRINNNRQ